MDTNFIYTLIIKPLDFYFTQRKTLVLITSVRTAGYALTTAKEKLNVYASQDTTVTNVNVSTKKFIVLGNFPCTSHIKQYKHFNSAINYVTVKTNELSRHSYEKKESR